MEHLNNPVFFRLWDGWQGWWYKYLIGIFVKAERKHCCSSHNQAHMWQQSWGEGGGGVRTFYQPLTETHIHTHIHIHAHAQTHTNIHTFSCEATNKIILYYSRLLIYILCAWDGMGWDGERGWMAEAGAVGGSDGSTLEFYMNAVRKPITLGQIVNWTLMEKTTCWLLFWFSWKSRRDV
jgi:hypothetical protein